MKITEIEILGLFGEVDVRLPILENRIILVGYNGLGKSTILNIFYYFVSQQWSKLQKQDFRAVSLKIGADERILRVDRPDIEAFLDLRVRKRRLHSRIRVPAILQDQIITYLQNSSVKQAPGKSRADGRSSYQVIEDVASRFDVPIHLAEEIYRYFRLTYQDELPLEMAGSVVAEVDRYLTDNLGGRILYLPTYRRIERYVKEVFPEIEEELQRKLLRRRDSFRSEAYIELVQFGMEDVSYNIKSRLENIRAYALAQVNNLTARYLRDVIRNEASQYSAIESGYIDDTAIKNVFAKVDNSILNDTDKSKLNDVVKKINDRIELQDNERYVAHYVMYLLELGNNISRLEAPILQFAQVCNSYLYGKRFEFDNIGYKLVVTRDSGRPVELEDLSSGEKQIVSLFSHLLLDDQKANYIFIDEPELSLSVDWQQRFLSDISNLASCKFIAAVTHSPFVFENELDAHTVDLLERTSAIK